MLSYYILQTKKKLLVARDSSIILYRSIEHNYDKKNKGYIKIEGQKEDKKMIRIGIIKREISR